MMRKPLTPILSPGSAPETMLPPDTIEKADSPTLRSSKSISTA